DKCVNMVITSPPYWGMRDYGVVPSVWGGKPDCKHQREERRLPRSGGKNKSDNPPGTANDKRNQSSPLRTKGASSHFCRECGAWKGSLGLEPTFDLYLEHLLSIFDEIWRVLRDDGTCWVNMGDKYGSKGMGVTKSLNLIPYRFAIGMTDRGWTVRNVLIWKKPNCMPSSAKDRFNVDFEPVFFFSKRKKYYFETQRTPYDKPLNRWGGDKLKADGLSSWDKGTGQDTYRDRDMRPNPLGRNKRTVWSICPQPFPEAHFAVYPEELCQTPIKSGCPEFVCKKCGKAREKIIEDGEDLPKGGGASIKYANSGLNLSPSSTLLTKTVKAKIDKGYTQCSCNAGFEGGISNWIGFNTGTIAQSGLQNHTSGGANSGLITVNASGDGCRSELFTFALGQRYRIEAWVWLIGGGTVNIGSVTTSTIDFTTSGESTTTTGSWVKIQAEAICVVAGTSRIKIWNSTSTDNFYIDDIVLAKIGCVAEYAPKGIGDATWEDQSDNSLDGTVVGATAIMPDDWASFYTDYSILGYHALTNQIIIMRDCTGKWSSGQDYGDAFLIDMDTGAITTGRRVFTKGIAYSNFSTDWGQNLIIAEQTSSTSVTIKKITDEPQSQAVGLIDIRTADIEFGNPAFRKDIDAIIVTYKSSAAQTNPVSYALEDNDAQTAWTRLTGNFDAETNWEKLVIEPTPFPCDSIRLKFDNPSAAGYIEINDVTIRYTEIPEALS
ncbi:hypothetical protein LCGC14_1345090, partial [marine sediment metagenome]